VHDREHHGAPGKVAIGEGMTPLPRASSFYALFFLEGLGFRIFKGYEILGFRVYEYFLKIHYKYKTFT
jgi:hypothetical protein